jgi:hypothetical protein
MIRANVPDYATADFRLQSATRVWQASCLPAVAVDVEERMNPSQNRRYCRKTEGVVVSPQ